MNGSPDADLGQDFRLPVQKDTEPFRHRRASVALSCQSEEQSLVSMLRLGQLAVKAAKPGFGQPLCQEPKALAASRLDDCRYQESVQLPLLLWLSHLFLKPLRVGISAIWRQPEPPLL